ncbi:hypothetical protein P9112_001324 [Eukaryota sp. TZLM1-RC]
MIEVAQTLLSITSLKPRLHFNQWEAKNSFSQPAFDVSHDSILTTTELSSNIDEELRSPLIAQFITVYFQTYHVVLRNPPLLPILPIHNPTEHPTQMHIMDVLYSMPRQILFLDHPSPCDQQPAHFPDRSERMGGVKSISCCYFFAHCFSPILVKFMLGEVWLWSCSS